MRSKSLSTEAHDAFTKWETDKYGNDTPLSDRDQELWIAGYVYGQSRVGKFNVYNHNGRLLGEFNTERDAKAEAEFYRDQTGNAAYVEEETA